MDKAKIEKIREDMLSSKGSKKTVFPVTLDEAVYVNRGNGVNGKPQYEKLPLTLKRKLENVVTMTFVHQEDEYVEPTYYYYLFTFTDVNNKNTFIDLINCDNNVFWNSVGGENNENGRELPTCKVGTIESFNERKAFSEFSSLYRDCTLIHNTSVEKWFIVDEDGKMYGDGDTIYSAKYPLNLRLFVDSIDESAGFFGSDGELVSFIKLGNVLYGIWFKSPVITQGENEYSLEVKLDARGYNNPNVYPNPSGGEMTISVFNILAAAAIRNGINFSVLPSDYPESSVDLPTYTQKTRYGKLNIQDEIHRWVDGNEVSVELNTHILPCHVNIVFLPEDHFYWEKPLVGQMIYLTASTNWVSTFEIKAVNANVSGVCALSSSESQFEMSLTGAEDSFASIINVPASSLENGVVIYIRPKNYNYSPNYLPFDTGSGFELINTVRCSYSYNDETTYRDLTVKCIIDENSPRLNREKITLVSSSFNIETNTGNLAVLCENIKSDLNIKVQTNLTRVGEDSFGTKPTLMNTVINSITSDNVAVSFDGAVIRKENIPRGTMVINYSVSEITPTTTEFSGLIATTFNLTTLQSTFRFIQETEKTFTENQEEQMDNLKEYLEETGENLIPLNNAGQAVVNSATGINTNVVTGNEASNVRFVEGGLSHKNDLHDADLAGLEIFVKETEIPELYFEGNTGLVNVTIPDNITTIGAWAFAHCPNMESIVIGNNVTTIGYGMCDGCTSLETVDLGTGISVVPLKAFYNCPNIRNIYFRYIGEEPGEELIRFESMLGSSNPTPFDMVVRESEVNIYVPQELVEQYETAFANLFPNANIQAIED